MEAESKSVPGTVEKFRKAIASYMGQTDYVSFVELKRHCRDFGDVDGSIAIQLEGNIILWSEMSSEFADAVMAMGKEGQIHYTPTTTLVYLIDGGALNLPIVKRPRAYKTVHWLPVCIRLGRNKNAA